MKRKRRAISDRGRLNWLIIHRGHVEKYANRYWVEAKQSQSIGADRLPEFYRSSARAAIDASILASRKKR